MPAIIAVLLGTWVFGEKAPSPMFAVNQLVFLSMGVVFAFLVGMTRLPRVARFDVIVAVIIVALLVTVAFSEGAMGVRRWLSVFGWNLQVTQIVWPLYVVALTGMFNHRLSRSALIFAITCLILLFVEHDVQASIAWGSATAIAIWMSSGFAIILRIAFGAVMVAMLLFALVFAPSLPVLVHVEGVLALIASRGMLSMVAAAMCAVLVVATPFTIARRAVRRTERSAMFAMGGALAALVASPLLLPNEPVILFGYGGSAIIGVFLALGIALSTARDGTQPTVIASS